MKALHEARSQLESLRRQEGEKVKETPELRLAWDAERLKLQALVGSVLSAEAMQALGLARRRPAELGWSVSWEVWDRAAADMARRYKYDLIKDLTDSTRRQLGQTIADWIERGDDFATLEEDIWRIIPRRPRGSYQDRAGMIAATEVTRIYADARVAELESVGLTRMRWRTAEDELVCPICAPLGQANGGEGAVGDVREMKFVHPEDGKVYGPPPAHVRCRCWIVEDHEELAEAALVREEDAVARWAGKPPKGFQSYADAEDWFKANHPKVSVKLSGADPRAAEEIAGAFDQVSHRYPFMGNVVTAVETADMPANVYARANLRTYKIEFNRHHVGDYEQMIESLRHDVEAGWHPEGTDSVAAVAVHELGHLVNAYLLSQQKAFTPVVRLDGIGLVSDTKKLFLKENKATPELSEYAIKNREEAWAEAFAALHFTRRRKWTRFVRRMEKLLDRIADPNRWLDEYRWYSDLSVEEREVFSEDMADLYQFAKELGLL
ncbi:MAG: hypothetical protein Kow0047_25770 [Anaerolineae bacterium]